MKNILIINGSLGGKSGNTTILIKEATNHLTTLGAKVDVIHLEDKIENLESVLAAADGFIFTSGTYWDSWGSPMQKFLEDTTQYETSNIFLFKPAAVMITMHSVGGKSVLSRLQGVLNTRGLMIPPMSGMVYSLATHLILNSDKRNENNFNEDFWSLEDIEIVVHNLMTAVNKKDNFKAWPVDKKDPTRRWL